MLISCNIGDLVVGKCRARVEKQILEIGSKRKTNNCQLLCPLTYLSSIILPTVLTSCVHDQFFGNLMLFRVGLISSAFPVGILL